MTAVSDFFGNALVVKKEDPVDSSPSYPIRYGEQVIISPVNDGDFFIILIIKYFELKNVGRPSFPLINVHLFTD